MVTRISIGYANGTTDCSVIVIKKVRLRPAFFGADKNHDEGQRGEIGKIKISVASNRELLDYQQQIFKCWI